VGAGEGITLKSGAGAAGLEGATEKVEACEGAVRTTGAAGCAGVMRGAIPVGGIKRTMGGGAAGFAGATGIVDGRAGVVLIAGACGGAA
jgi:hypothetical protein